MAGTLGKCLLWLSAPLLASACSGNVFGICNQYNGTVRFENLETRSERCTADALGKCKIPSHHDKGSWIPHCQQANEYPMHHMTIKSDDGLVDFKIWNDYDKKAVRGGYNYGAKHDLAKTCGEEFQWNIVVHANGNVSLWLAADYESCPQSPEITKCQDINSKQASWVAISSTSVEQEVSIAKGTKREYEVKNKNAWGWSVAVSVEAGFEMGGTKDTFKVTGEVSEDMARTYTSTFSKETSVKETFGPFPPGTVWQWQWLIRDGCGSSTAGGNDIVSTKGKWQEPCCLPGYFTEPEDATSECHPSRDGTVYDLCSKSRKRLLV